MAQVKSLGYNIVIGKSAFKKLESFLLRRNYSSSFILCDSNTYRHCLKPLVKQCPALANARVIVVKSGETTKSIKFCAQIWQTLSENGANKDSVIINLGGGVVSDLGGFCASVFKRGIDFINVPTTLLAMADASVGGKTGIDFNLVKNLIGTINQPRAVFVEPVFLQTLPKRHSNNGLAEIFKIALVLDKNFWHELKNITVWKPEKLLLRSIRLKNKIVIRDPFDKGGRHILNFGHTVGHALELMDVKPQKLLHGEAIFIGMVVESHLAWQKKRITKQQLNEITLVLKPRITRLTNIISSKLLLNNMRNDKKNKRNKLLFALLSGIGSCGYDVEIKEEQLKKALTFYNTLFI